MALGVRAEVRAPSQNSGRHRLTFFQGSKPTSVAHQIAVGVEAKRITPALTLRSSAGMGGNGRRPKTWRAGRPAPASVGQIRPLSTTLRILGRFCAARPGKAVELLLQVDALGATQQVGRPAAKAAPAGRASEEHPAMGHGTDIRSWPLARLAGSVRCVRTSAAPWPCWLEQNRRGFGPQPPCSQNAEPHRHPAMHATSTERELVMALSL